MVKTPRSKGGVLPLQKDKPMPFLLRYWKPLAITLAAVFLFSYGYLKGGDHERDSWIKARLAAVERNLQLNNEVSDALQKQHDITRSRYDDIRVRSSGRVFVSASGKCDERASNKGVSGDVGETIARLMRDAELQTNQLIACQEWIRRTAEGK